MRSERVYESHIDLLRMERPDVVSVATPTSTHADRLAEDCVLAGVHSIFLEKPVAMTRERLPPSGDRPSAWHANAVNHTRRGDQLYRRARQLIADGVIGDVHSLIGVPCGGLIETAPMRLTC